MKPKNQISQLLFALALACSISIPAHADQKNSGDIERAEYSVRAGTIEDALASAKEKCKRNVPYLAHFIESKQIKKEICKGGED